MPVYSERRRHRRIAFDAPAIVVEAGSIGLHTPTDLSEGGIYLHTDQALPAVGRVVRIELAFGPDSRLHIDGVVVRRDTVDSSTKGNGYALEFRELDDDERDRLIAEIARVQRADGG